MMSGGQRETLVLRIDGQDVIIRLERQVTDALSDIAEREGMSRDDLMLRVAEESKGGPGSLASALRTFVIAYQILEEA